MVACLDNCRSRQIPGADPCFDKESEDLLSKAPASQLSADSYLDEACFSGALNRYYRDISFLDIHPSQSRASSRRRYKLLARHQYFT